METFKKINLSEYFHRFLIHGVRPDGRKLSQVRKTRITSPALSDEFLSSRPCEGSCLVELGSTKVIAGVICEVGKHSKLSEEIPNSANQIVVNVELLPLCSTRFRPGKRPEQAQILSTFLNSLIKEIVPIEDLYLRGSKGEVISQMHVKEQAKTKEQQKTEEVRLDSKKSEEDQELLTWYLVIELYCLNYAGNALDACVIAMLASLLDVRLPSVIISDDGRVYTLPNTVYHRLSLVRCPVAVTFGLLREFVIVDPSNEEEEQLDASFTIVCDAALILSKDRNDRILYTIQKSGDTAIPEDTIFQCLHDVVIPRVEQVYEQLCKDHENRISHRMKISGQL